MTKKQLKCYYLLLIRHHKLSLLNQFWEGYSITAAWGSYFKKKNFFHFSIPLKCHWPIRVSSLKSHSPAGRIYSPLATGRVLMKRLPLSMADPGFSWGGAPTSISAIILQTFCRKLHGNERIWTGGRPLDPPMLSYALADPRGGARDARPPLGVQILSFSCSFWQKIEK